MEKHEGRWSSRGRLPGVFVWRKDTQGKTKSSDQDFTSAHFVFLDVYISAYVLPFLHTLLNVYTCIHIFLYVYTSLYANLPLNSAGDGRSCPRICWRCCRPREGSPAGEWCSTAAQKVSNAQSRQNHSGKTPILCCKKQCKCKASK